MIIKSLSALRQRERKEITLAGLPEAVYASNYAMAKAFKINELVRSIHKSSYEWYGFTIGARDDPELIVDIGLPYNDENVHHYTGINPERIADFQESLSLDLVVNGWIHSHGNLGFKQFSKTDEQNHLTVLHYVTASLRKPVAKREVLIQDLRLLVRNELSGSELEQGTVSLITDVPVAEATIMEAIYGGFSYGIVIGDEGWHEQEIHYIRRGILTGHTIQSMKKADLVFKDTGSLPAESDVSRLADEVREKIRCPKPLAFNVTSMTARLQL